MFFLLNTAGLQAQTLPPFLYYYSASQSAILIERADGTDSRILTEIDVEEDSKMVVGPGWSPSGNWLAVNVVYVIQGFTQHSLDAFVIDQTGEKRLPVMEEPEQEVTIEMSWSPVEDILLVEYTYSDSNSGGVERVEIKLFNLNTQTAIREYDVPGNPVAAFNVEWAADGKSLQLIYVDEQTYLRTIDLTGETLLERQIDTACGNYQVYPSPDNQFTAFASGGALMLSDTATSNVVKSFPFPTKVINLIDWSQDGKYALVYVSSTCDELSTRLWLLTVPDFELHLLLDKVDFPAYTFISSTGRYQSVPASVWSDCNQGFAVSRGRVYLITSDPAEATRIELPDENRHSLMSWDDCNLLIATYNPAKLYSFASDDKRLAEVSLKVLPQAIRYVSLSPTKTYMAYAGDGGSYIENTATGGNTEITLLDHNLIMGRPYSFNQVIWHPQQDWFLTLMDSESEHLINVISADTGLQRELTICFNARSCFGWLPGTSS